jgi:hypothetical protein
VAHGPGDPWYWFVLGVLAVWRVTHLLHVEHGPWGLVQTFRVQMARIGLGDLVACFFCLSLWIAVPVAFWMSARWSARCVSWLALSAGAILLELWSVGKPEASREGKDT